MYSSDDSDHDDYIQADAIGEQWPPPHSIPKVDHHGNLIPPPMRPVTLPLGPKTHATRKELLNRQVS